MDFKALEAGYQARKAAGQYKDFGVTSAPEMKKQPGGLGGWVARNLNTIGMIALPTVATLATGGLALPAAAALAGIGGAAGEAGKRALTGEKQDIGESLKQGAIGAGLEVGTAGLGGIIGKALGRGGEAAAKGAGEGALKSGEKMLADAWGIAPAAKVGSHELSTAESRSALDYLRGITKSNAPDKVLADLEAHLEKTGKTLGDLVSKGNRALTSEEFDALAPHLSAIEKHLPSGVSAIPEDLASSQKLKQTLDNMLSYNKTAGSATSATQFELKSARDALSNTLNSAIDGLGEHNAIYSQGKDIQPFISKTVRSPKGVSLPFKAVGGKSGVVGEKVAATRAAMGKAVAGGGAGAESLAGLGGIIKPVAGRLATRELASSMVAPPPSTPDAVDTSTMGTAPDTIPTDGTAPDTGANMFSQENLQPLIVEALAKGDTKSVATLVSLYNTFGKAGTDSIKQKAAQDVSMASSAINSLEQNLKTAGGPKGITGLISRLPGLGSIAGGDLAKQKAYESQKIEIATQLARALTGSARPGQKVIDYYMHSLPSVGDSGDVVQYKLQFLRNELSNRSQSVGDTSVSSNPLDIQGLQ